jgi:hypothetical protein
MEPIFPGTCSIDTRVIIVRAKSGNSLDQVLH